MADTQTLHPRDGAGDAPTRDRLFAELVVRCGLLDERTVTQAKELAPSTESEQTLADRLVRDGRLSGDARRAVELLVEEQLTATGGSTPAPDGPGASTFPRTATHDGPTALPSGGQTTRFGEYELLSEIARGGMGVVYLARQMALGRTVALKMIRSGALADDREVKRFHTEAEAVAKLDHPGIVPVFDVGEWGGHHFFSMAYVAGQSLAHRLRDDGPLSPTAAARLLHAIAEAVQYAHDKGILHRDIKPQNILLDEAGHPRLVDFGLAKQMQAGSDLTHTGQVMGTPSYMPPEQASGATRWVGPTADVYSLGATLYAVLTGRPPFQASTSAETVRLVLDAPPVSPRRLNRAIPADLDTICLKCLSKSPEQRYPTARELADDLARFSEGQPIRARPVPAWVRGWKWARRRPVAAALAAVSAVAVLALVAVVVSVGYQGRLAALNDTLEGRNVDLRAATREAELQRDEATRAKRDLARFRYDSDLAMAGRAWREGDIGRVKRLLNQTRPAPGDDDLRGFEWYYLHGLLDNEEWRTDQHCQLSPDGKYLAVAANDGIDLLDPKTRKPIRRLTTKRLEYTGFTFSRDGRRLIHPTAVNEVVVWDVDAGKVVGRLKADDLTYAAASLSTDGALATTSGQGHDHSIRLWDVATGKELHKWSWPGGYAMVAAFSPAGDKLAFGRGLGTVEVYDTANGEKLHTDDTRALYLRQLVYHPSGKWLVSAAANGVKFWNADTGEAETPAVLSGGLTGVGVAFSPSGKHVVTAVTADNSLHLWDGETGKLLSTRRGHTTTISGVAVGPGGVLALSAAGDGVRLWDLRGDQEARDVTGPFREARNVRFSPVSGSDRLAFLDEKGRLILSDGKTGRAFGDRIPAIAGFEFSPEGTRFVAVHMDGSAAAWDIATGKKVFTVRPPGTHFVGLAVDPAGTRFATASATHLIHLWDAKTGLLLNTFPAPKTNNGIVKLYFRPTTDELIVAHAFEPMQRIHLGDAPRIEPLVRPEWDRARTYALKFSPDGARIATARGVDETVVWRFPELTPERVFRGHTGFIGGFAFGPRGQRFASASADGTVKVWDLATGQEMLTLSTPPPYDFAISADGRRMAVGGPGGVRVWDSARGRVAEAAAR